MTEEEESRVVLGIDPGTLITGYGVVALNGGTTTYVASGVIRNNASVPLPHRLSNIYRRLNEIIAAHSPGEFAIESAFYGKNAQSALKLGHARGVSILAAVEHSLTTVEYSPREVKKAVVGRGSASKEQVQYMVKALLHLDDSRMLMDTSDALAVALCHLHRSRIPAAIHRDWKSYVAAHPERVRQ